MRPQRSDARDEALSAPNGYAPMAAMRVVRATRPVTAGRRCGESRPLLAILSINEIVLERAPVPPRCPFAVNRRANVFQRSGKRERNPKRLRSRFFTLCRWLSAPMRALPRNRYLGTSIVAQSW